MALYSVNKNCMQGLSPYENEECQGGAVCAKCGWNVRVCNARNKKINEEGLTLCSDGLRKLIVD